MLLTSLLIGAVLLPGSVPQQRTDTTLAVRGAGTLRVDSRAGRVVVRAGDDGRVRVRATHEPEMRIDVRTDANGVRVQAANTRGRVDRPIEFEISVPPAWGVRIDAHGADVLVDRVRGDVHVTSVNGDVDARGGANLTLNTVQGSITVNGARGRVNATAVNDGIRIEDVVGDVRAETLNGGLTLLRIDAARVDASSLNGRVTFEGRLRAGGRYDFTSHNGDILLTLPEGTDADVTVSTHRGDIEADFPVQVRGVVNARGSLNFALGRGGAQLRLESFNGAIRLRRAGR